jgi:hypothetical protein
MANETKKANFWGDFASKAAGAAAGPLGELGVSLLASSLIKPNKNPMFAEQQADYAKKRRLMNYYDSYLNDQQQMYNKYNPVYQKTTDMAIEAANKPLTGTDMFKGLGPVNDIMNQQNAQANAAGIQTANNAGLYGGARTGLMNTVNNAGKNAITKSLSDFQGAYEAAAPQRAAAAQGMAAGAYGNASQGMLGAVSGLNAGYSDLASMAQGLGQQRQATLDEATAKQSALMGMLGDMFASKNQQQMFNKQLKQQQNYADQMAGMYARMNGEMSPMKPVPITPTLNFPTGINIPQYGVPYRPFASKTNQFNLGGPR